ncbi:MAG: sodium:calcium antiporter [Clostridia bacterium]|nr:sodium:calcium antiporter [Clostridia bacterium]MDD4047958.1 sodium:calcium antiporter [Clostridia bacterium]
MDLIIYDYLAVLVTPILFLVILGTLFFLSKGADILVEEAVSLSLHWGIPKMIIGATIVSLGTTLPEASVSVLAALNGNPDLALGNAIGSIIVDTGLIIGLAAMIGKLPIEQSVVNRQGKIQVLAGILLAVVSLPFFTAYDYGVISQNIGFIFLGLLVLYIFISIKWAKDTNQTSEDYHAEKSSGILLLLKLFGSVALIIISSKILIPSIEITAIRIGIPQSIIAATLIAFGTSLPELVTAVTAVKKGHGELAVGNIVGADILNVLFVIGSAAAFTGNGLKVPVDFYKLQIPAMLIILISFRIFSITSNGKSISKIKGLFLFVLYVVYLVLNSFLI